jgi:hypothetical protein
LFFISPFFLALMSPRRSKSDRSSPSFACGTCLANTLCTNRAAKATKRENYGGNAIEKDINAKNFTVFNQLVSLAFRRAVGGRQTEMRQSETA